jgi:hypothetical protein
VGNAIRDRLACVAMLNSVAVVIDIIDATNFELSLLSPLLCRYRRSVRTARHPRPCRPCGVLLFDVRWGMQSEFDSLVSLYSTVLGVAVVIDIIDATDFELSLLSPLLCRYRRPVASGVLLSILVCFG